MLATLLAPLVLAAPPLHDEDWLDRFLEGSRALERGELASARDALAGALELLPEHGATAWMLARACASAGDVDAAFDWLARAAAWGGGEVALLEWEPELEPLREDPRFGALREVLAARDSSRSREARPPRLSLDPVVAGRGGVLGRAVAHPLRDELWVGASDGRIRRLDARTGRALAWRGLRSGAAIASLAFDGSGTRLAAVDVAGTLRLLDGADGTLRVEVREAVAPGSARREPAVFARDGELLLVRDTDSTLGVFDTATGRLVERVDLGAERRAWACSDSGRFVASSLGDEGVAIVDRDGRGMPGRLACRAAAVAFEPGRERLWIGTLDSKIRVVELPAGEVVQVLKLADLDPFGEPVETWCIDFDEHGETAISSSSHFANIVAWDVASGERRWSYGYTSGNPGAVRCAVSPGGGIACAWGQGSWTPRIVDGRDGSTLVDLRGRGGRCVCLPSEDLVAVETAEGLRVLDVDTGRFLWTRIGFGKGGWLLRSEQDWCDGTRAALADVRVRLDGEALPLDALAAALVDPSRVRAAAAGIELLPPRLPRLSELPRLDWASPVERVTTLAPGEESPVLAFTASCADGLRGLEVLRDGERTLLGPAALARFTPRAPGAEESVHYRFRPISTTGVLGRALHWTLVRTASR